jgi:hypothetical protein
MYRRTDRTSTSNYCNKFERQHDYAPKERGSTDIIRQREKDNEILVQRVALCPTQGLKRPNVFALSRIGG